MKKVKATALLLACLMSVSALVTGCDSAPASTDDGTGSAAQSTEGGGQKEEQGDPVELSFYIQNSAVIDQDRIMEKANAIIKDEINATLNLVMVDPSNYAQKINLMISSGDDWDLCFMSDWGGMNYYENAKAGAFADLTELLPELAPVSYSKVPENIWQNMMVDGKIYGVFNYQQYGYAARKGFELQKNLVDEFGYDWQALKDNRDIIGILNSFTPFFEQVVAKYPDKICWETSANYSLFTNDPLYFEMENIGTNNVPGWIRYDDPTTVINQYETEEFAAYCKILREWYEKGLVRKDGATLTDTNPDRKAGKIVALWHYGWPDDIDLPGQATGMSMTSASECPAYAVSTTRTILPAGVNAAVAVNAESDHIEKAVELIELLNSNDEVFNLISLGEEGVDYEYDEDGNFQIIDGKYNFNYSEWEIGQSFDENFSRSTAGKNEQGDIWKSGMTQIYETEKTCEGSPLAGFVFDQEPVKTEVAAVTSIVTEMVPALTSGSVDPDEMLPQFLQRLKDNGADAIIAEKQAQLDAFLASK